MADTDSLITVTAEHSILKEQFGHLDGAPAFFNDLGIGDFRPFSRPFRSR
jgi:hypothetical protein